MSLNHFDFSIKESSIINGITIIDGTINKDLRGVIYTSYQKNLFDHLLPENLKFHHDKFTISKKGVLRGLHYDKKTWKLISCVSGEIFQVVVDHRPKSNTYLKWQSWYLKQDEPVFILIPPFFANGFCALKKNSVYHYKLAYKGEYNDADKQCVLKWDDPRLNISWPIDQPILQEKDK